jgi:hypothetical protein
MLGLISRTWWLFGLVLAALAFFLAAYFWFYRGSYTAPPSVSIPFERFGPPSSAFSSFSEEPPVRQGTMLVDTVHSNDFSLDEVGVLLARVADRGYDVESAGDTFPWGGFRSLPEGQRLFLLDEKLRGADSYVVILPQDPFTEEEADLVERFIQKGGKLLLVADPTRSHQINSLAERFGLSFRPDYLYNTLEFDLNFQDVFIRDFLPDEITRGLGRIVLYTAGSIASRGSGLAYTDGNTRSSMAESIQPFYPVVKQADGRVVAISDLTFMIPPQNSIVDNDTLVSNLADYLTDSRRRFDLADFPHFFKGEVDIILGRSSLFDMGTQLKDTLSSFQISSQVQGGEDLTRDTVFLGLYDDASRVTQYLEAAGIQVGGELRTPFTPDLSAGEAALILLHRGQNRSVLILLGDSERAVSGLVQRLEFNDLRDGLVGDLLGVYRGF